MYYVYNGGDILGCMRGVKRRGILGAFKGKRYTGGENGTKSP
jgi:hypothetical protein